MIISVKCSIKLILILVPFETLSKEIVTITDQIAIKEEIVSENHSPSIVSIESNIKTDLSSLDTSSSHDPPSIPSQIIPEFNSSSRSNSRTIVQKRKSIRSK